MARERLKRLLLVGAVLGAILALLGIGAYSFMSRMAALGEAMGPNEFSGPTAGDVFRREFPEIYHFLADDDRYEAASFRVLRGLGGRWGKLTMVGQDDAVINQSEVVEKLRSGFAAGEWSPAPQDPVVREVSSIFFDAQEGELSPSDLTFSHVALPDEREHVFHRCRVFVSSDAKRIVAYCAMGW